MNTYYNIEIKRTLLIAIEILLFSSFIWALVFWFRKTLQVKRWELSVIKISGIVFVFANLYSAFTHKLPINSIYAAGIVLLLISAFLFFAALHSFKEAPGVAFINEILVGLNTNGPYQYIRHPFYTSYILAWLGSAIASGNYWIIMALLVIVYIYYKAATEEEALWLSGAHAEEYAKYMNTTGRFLPSFINPFKIHVIQLTKEYDLQQYRLNYFKLTNVSIPDDYLKRNKVYGFYNSKELIGGFVIGISSPFRTIELFANPVLHDNLNKFLNDGKKVCEVCCFWHVKGISFINSMFIWFTMAQKVNEKDKHFFLGGTNVFGLANIYAYPKYAHLISESDVNSKPAWIFIAWKKYSFISAIHVMGYKITKIIKAKLHIKYNTCIHFEKQYIDRVAKELGSKIQLCNGNLITNTEDTLHYQ